MPGDRAAMEAALLPLTAIETPEFLHTHTVPLLQAACLTLTEVRIQEMRLLLVSVQNHYNTR